MSRLAPALPSHAEATIHQFLRAHVRDAGAAGGLVALSGGIDSALVARLARDALGPSSVHGLQLPDAAFPRALAEETEAYARDLGIASRTVPIAPIEDAVRGLLPEMDDRETLGNVKARARMIVLYSVARARRLLVLGTGNKSELLLGYFTKFGDGGVDLLPVGDLYKTQLRALAARLGLPEAVLARPPTAGLWEGQTDEDELGITYERVDRILVGTENLLSPEEIAAETGESVDTVRGIQARILANRHKRVPPPIPKLGRRTIGIDWRD
jgi:NAD+ synthase